jgi:hypothetical protein
VRGAEGEKAADDHCKPIALERPANALANFNASVEHGCDEHEAYEKTVVRGGLEAWNISGEPAVVQPSAAPRKKRSATRSKLRKGVEKMKGEHRQRLLKLRQTQ